MEAREFCTDVNLSRLYHDPSSVRHCVSGIQTQVNDDLFHLGGVGGHRGEIRRKDCGELDAVAHHTPEEALDPCDQGIQVHILGLQDLLPGKCKQLSDQTSRASYLFADRIEPLTRRAVLRHLTVSQLRPAENDSKSVVDVVRYAASKSPDGLKSPELIELLFESPQFSTLFRFLQLSPDRGKKTCHVILHHIVLRALLEGLHRDVFANRARQENEGRLRVSCAQQSERLQSGTARHRLITNDHAPPFPASASAHAGRCIDSLVCDVIPSTAQFADEQDRIIL